MGKRILTAIVMIAVFVGVLALRQISTVFFDFLGFLVAAACLYEMYLAFAEGGYKPMTVPIIVNFALYIVLFYLSGAAGVVYWLIIATVISLVYFTFSSEYTVADCAVTVMTSVYPLSIIYLTLLLNGIGLIFLILPIVISVFTDTAAYFVGVSLKGPKLCPSISPKKTVSGAIGGILGGVLGSLVVYFTFEYFALFPFADVQTLGFGDVSIWIYVIVGLGGAILNTLGDLATSRIKRCCGIKDFGKIFPGHGGIMDRIDGMLFVVPLVYLVVAL